VKTDYRADTYVHRIRLAALNANTRYYYRVYDGADTTDMFDFYTAARPGDEFTFAVMGDTRSNPDIHNIIAGELLKHRPRMSIYGGDLCYSHKYSSWKDEFFVDNQLKVAAAAPFFNAIGNHEDWRQNTRAFQEAPESASGEEYFFSFDYGDAHFLILSTEHAVDEGSRQWKFAKKDLESTDRNWKFVAFHIPAFCFGGHDGSSAMQKMSREIFEPAGVDMVFSGHSHFYQHNFTGGIHHFVVAGGGAPLYSPESGEMTVKSAKEFHYAILKVSPLKVDMKVYDMYENVLDTLTLEK
jgi:predicted phosphodiesterase